MHHESERDRSFPTRRAKWSVRKLSGAALDRSARCGCDPRTPAGAGDEVRLQQAGAIQLGSFILILARQLTTTKSYSPNYYSQITSPTPLLPTSTNQQYKPLSFCHILRLYQSFQRPVAIVKHLPAGPVTVFCNLHFNPPPPSPPLFSIQPTPHTTLCLLYTTYPPERSR